MKFFAGLIVGLLLAAAIPLVAVMTGAVNMAATRKPGGLEKAFGTMAWEKSMEKRAADIKNPYANDSSVLPVGLAHYQENCFICHAAPGMKVGEIGQGLNPPPPLLDDVDDMTDGQLFWVIKNGIRMTGMPAFGPSHDDKEIWKMVSFVRHLPKLTDEEKEMLSSIAMEEEGHHHEEGTQTSEPEESEEHEHHHRH